MYQNVTWNLCIHVAFALIGKKLFYGIPCIWVHLTKREFIIIQLQYLHRNVDIFPKWEITCFKIAPTFVLLFL